MGKIEYGTLYPYDVQPAGGGQWDLVSHRDSTRVRMRDYDEAVRRALAMKRAYDKEKQSAR